MTKRACPFDTTIYRQLKVHVNEYENDSNAKKEIEEKTIRKLMSGSHYLLPNNCSIQAFQADSKKLDAVDSTAGPSTSSCTKNKIIKQQQVTNYFSNGKKQNVENSVVPNDVTDCCLVCFYCDIKNANLHQCPKCQEKFCQSCSFISYGKSEDVWICMSCS